MKDITPIGIIQFRDKSVKFGIKRDDRRRHMYIIGKTGTGKTTLIENLLVHDIVNGEGLGYLDPHGDSVKRLLKYVPKERIEDIVYFDPSDISHPVAFNPLEKVDWESRHIVASSIMSVFKKIWVDAWSARMEYILTNTLLALLELEGSTLLDINRMLGDDKFRASVIVRLRDPVVKAFWDNEFARYHSQFRTEAVAPIQNKVGQFITNPLIRNIIGQPKSSVNLREMMDNKKVFLANLSKGALGEESATLLGGLLITSFQIAAMSRVDIPENERSDFQLYIDEFQNFATESFINILSEARKYRLNLVLAHQYLDQVLEEIMQAVFGNVGSFIVFRVGSLDGEMFEKEFSSIYTQEFLDLPKYHAYVKLLVDGVSSRPFLTTTFALPPEPEHPLDEEIIKISRLKFAKNKAVVEARISQTYQAVASGKKDEQIIVYCSQCHQQFYTSKKHPEEICPDCLNTHESSGLSLKNLSGGDLTQSIKESKNQKKNEEKQDYVMSLLKKLKGEEEV